MSRKPRLFYPGAFYHVMLRGNAKQVIFGEQEAYHQFEYYLAEGLMQHSHRLHAYCWMGNHLHMLLQSADSPLSEMMQVLSQRYTRWFNHRHDRVGHLFQGRYKALLVDADAYLLELVRYIHLNPVRAGLVDEVGHYQWSSHHAYLGSRTTPWLTTDWVMRQFDEDLDAARSRYLRFLGEPVDEQRQEELSRGTAEGRIIGDDRFRQKMEKSSRKQPARDIPLEQIVALVAREVGVSERELCSGSRRHAITQARAMITLLAMDEGSRTLSETADYFGRDPTVLSRQIKSLREKADKITVVRDELECYRKALKQQA